MIASAKSANARAVEPFEFKSAALNLIAFTPNTANLPQLDDALKRRLGGNADFFGGDAAILDLSAWPESANADDLSALLGLLRQYGLQTVAARASHALIADQARRAGLAVLPDSTGSRELPAEKAAPAPSPAPVPANSMIIDRPVRSGQQVYARGGDLIVLALVSHGAEVIADGNVHVYAPLRGRAVAGARGDSRARIFTHCMEAELLSVAGVYRAIEEALPESIMGRAAQVRLDGNKLVIESMKLD
ncbi:septum site-determining protein MinC [Chitinimonas sp.]|uniref:septum site-determining protein MinC n=1 Tax=Chitinimonas sp. TaxID=1934313 RepID=UPI0035B21584